MDKRRQKLLAGITKDMCGLEIAPWFAPIAPKSEGYNVKILDFFPREELYKRAVASPDIPDGTEKLIEEVDFVGNASDIARIASGEYDYLISSHNFEHLPDPIGFLQGVESLLKKNGKLIMALPDCRYTFDRYRSHTLIGEWVDAHREGREKPTRKQIFEFHAYLGTNVDDRLCGDLVDAWRNWDRTEFTDVHCTLFFPTSFELLMLEAQALGLTRLSVKKIERRLAEFFVWLELADGPPQNLRERRERLLKEIRSEVGFLAILKNKMRRKVEVLSNMVGF